ncbi:hypothetical protein ACWEKR_34825 [Nocardia sp. NPDC004573]
MSSDRSTGAERSARPGRWISAESTVTAGGLEPSAISVRRTGAGSSKASLRPYTDSYFEERAAGGRNGADSSTAGTATSCGADARTGALGTVGHGRTTRLDHGVAEVFRAHGVGIALRSGASAASGAPSEAGISAAAVEVKAASARSNPSLTSASAEAMAAFNSPTVREASTMSRSSVDTSTRSSPVSIRDG